MNSIKSFAFKIECVGSLGIVVCPPKELTGLRAFGKAAEMADHTALFKTDGMTAFRTDFSKEAVPVSLFLVGAVFQISFLKNSANGVRDR